MESVFQCQLNVLSWKYPEYFYQLPCQFNVQHDQFSSEVIINQILDSLIPKFRNLMAASFWLKCLKAAALDKKKSWPVATSHVKIFQAATSQTYIEG